MSVFGQRPNRRNFRQVNYPYPTANLQAMNQSFQPIQAQIPNQMLAYSNIPASQTGGYGPVQAYPHQGYYLNQSNMVPKKQPKLAETVFQNPLQQPEMSYYPQASQMMNQSYLNPYPKQSGIPKPPSGMKTFMNSFKGQDGSFDVNKMVNTAGQMMNAVSQVSSMVKGLGGIFKV